MRRAKRRCVARSPRRAKFWVCKRGCELAAEAMEILGGNGYTEELSLARIAREMPVNSIWEGSGNIMCLDVLRAFGKSRRDRRGRAARAVDGARPEPLFRRRFRALRRVPSPKARARRSHGASRKAFVTLMQAQLLLGAAARLRRRARRRGGVLRDALESRSGLGRGLRRGRARVGCRRCC